VGINLVGRRKGGNKMNEIEKLEKLIETARKKVLYLEGDLESAIEELRELEEWYDMNIEEWKEMERK
tara:strand:+ start:55 stop:255 length:201 start_codon:yes stop_codon:yes gene_type:complete